MGEHMKMLSLRQINEQIMASPEKNQVKNTLHFDNGFLGVKDVFLLIFFKFFQWFFAFFIVFFVFFIVFLYFFIFFHKTA